MKQLTLLLKPRWGEDTVANMSVYAAYPASEFDKDLSKPALQYAEQAFGGLCPFPEWEDFSITDDLGDIPFEIKDIPSFYTAATYKGIFFLRAPDGEVKWSMKLQPVLRFPRRALGAERFEHVQYHFPGRTDSNARCGSLGLGPQRNAGRRKRNLVLRRRRRR